MTPLNGTVENAAIEFIEQREKDGMKTLKGMTTLEKAIVNRLGREELQSTLQDVVNHGADCGFPGFCYYSDTSAFTKRHRKEIIALLEAMAVDLGQTNAELLASFRVVMDLSIDRDTCAAYLASGKVNENDRVQLDNALAWFALEEVARSLTE